VADPILSKAQWRKLTKLAAEGKIKAKTYADKVKASKPFDELPEHVGDEAPGRSYKKGFGVI
jgi:hypothetical protein